VDFHFGPIMLIKALSGRRRDHFLRTAGILGRGGPPRLEPIHPATFAQILEGPARHDRFMNGATLSQAARQFGRGPVGYDGQPHPFCGGSRSGGNQRDRLKGQAGNGPTEDDKGLDNSVAQPNI
jgi:hypothetical protein